MKYDLDTIRHSTAHVMASAVKNLYPRTKIGIGPTIEDGFYYDFDSNHRFSKSDFNKIIKEMSSIKRSKVPFERVEKSIDKAVKYVKEIGEPYKEMIIQDLKESGETKVSFYKTGSFVDLCRGPHVSNSSQIGEFEILSVAGAYWKGSEKNKMLQRIYATAWETRADLEDYLIKREQAKERDHRKIGKELDLFMISEEVGLGLPLWLPKGAAIRRELENFVVDLEKKYGFDHVYSPILGNLNLYKTSGHWQHYRNLMYSPVSIEEEQYLLRPMICPHHIVIYKHKPKSYRDLPVRIAEEGIVYRFEKSGELSGLSRVRSFTINDAHIFCTKDQIVSEVKNILGLINKLYKATGLKEYTLDLALKDNDKEKYVKGEKMWSEVEEALKEALDKSGEKYSIKKGEAAFYGPKIDVQAKDALGREFTLSTIQLDAYLPKKFNLEYTDSNGKKQTPFLIHRALIGSFERFFAFLIEHHAGKFPVWLSPIQTKILPIADRHNVYAQSVEKILKEHNIRVEVDSRNETLQSKIRDAQLEKVPYMLVVGDKEKINKKVSVRERDKKELEVLEVEDFSTKFLKKIHSERNV